MRWHTVLLAFAHRLACSHANTEKPGLFLRGPPVGDRKRGDHVRGHQCPAGGPCLCLCLCPCPCPVSVSVSVSLTPCPSLSVYVPWCLRLRARISYMRIFKNKQKSCSAQSSKYPTPYVPVPHPLWSPPPRLSRPLAGAPELERSGGPRRRPSLAIILPPPSCPRPLAGVCAPARAGARVLQIPTPPLI